MWLRYAFQQEMFDPSDYMESPEAVRRRQLSILPPEHSKHHLGPFFHGGPAAADIMLPESRGLAVDKIPTFGGVNNPLWPRGLYFGTSSDIAEEYAAGNVQGMEYNNVISNTDEYLRYMDDWDAERIAAADENEYENFERDFELAHEYSGVEDSAFEISASSAATIIWEHIRNKNQPDRAGVVGFHTDLENMRPDEDFMFQLVHHDARSACGYNAGNLHGMLHPEKVNEIRQATMKYLAEDLAEHIVDDKLLDIDADTVSSALLSADDTFEAVDNLIELLRQTYTSEDDDGYLDFVDPDMFAVANEIDVETAISMEITNTVIAAAKPDTLRALGIISMAGCGKAATKPIPRSEYEKHQVERVSGR